MAAVDVLWPQPVAVEPKWALPPVQRILGPEETAFPLNRVAQELTIIMSTSVGDFTPSPDKVLTALSSLQANTALRWCRKLLVFDQVPSEKAIADLKAWDMKMWNDQIRGPKWEKLWREKRQAYEDYCDAMRGFKDRDHPALFGVELLFLDKFGHLYGTVRRGMEAVATPYVFVTQHDLRLSPKLAAADVQRILELLHCRTASYIVLNRDRNDTPRTMGYYALQGLRNVTVEGTKLTGMAGFSDQSHFARVNWYFEEVLNAIPVSKRLTCMEHLLHEPWKSGPWRETFLYGGLEDGPYVYDQIHGVQVRSESGQLHGIKAMPERAVPM